MTDIVICISTSNINKGLNFQIFSTFHVKTKSSNERILLKFIEFYVKTIYYKIKSFYIINKITYYFMELERKKRVIYFNRSLIAKLFQLSATNAITPRTFLIQ